MSDNQQTMCEVCGNSYDKTFEIVMRGKSHRFDCFECAIHALAPACTHCGCRVLGHGVEMNSTIYCCAHCATQTGKVGLKDRIETSQPSADSGLKNPALHH